MPRPRRRLRRRTVRLRRRWHRLVRPLRRPARVALTLAVLGVAVLGLWAEATAPPTAWTRVPVEPGPDGAAVVGDLPRGDAALAGLRPGDRLLTLDGDSVALGPGGAATVLAEERGLGDTLAVRFERGGVERAAAVVVGGRELRDARRFGLSHPTMLRVRNGTLLLALLAFVGVGAFLVVRSGVRGYHAELGRALVAVVALFGLQAIDRLDLVSAIGRAATGVVVAFAYVVAFAALPAVAEALVRFPEGRYVPRWTRRMGRIVWAGVVGVIVLTILTFELGAPAWARERGVGAVLLALVALPAVGLVQKYRRAADAAVRQRMKWVVLPVSVFVAALFVTLLSDAVPLLDADRRATGYLFTSAMHVALDLGLAAIPLGVLAGVLHFRPWDADLWIARSAAVGAATLGLAAAFAGGAEALRLGLRASMGDGAEAVAAALAAVVALVVFNPVREWLTRRADADLHRTRERLTERLPLLLAGRQVVATPEEIGRVAIAAVRDALATGRAAVLDLDAGGWEVVAADGVAPPDALAWADATLDAAALPPASEQVWEDPLFVLRVPLRSAEDEVVGVLALGTHGKGRGYSTEERKALDAASRSLAEALRVAERRVEAEARLLARLAEGRGEAV